MRWKERQCRSVQSIIGAIENLMSKSFISFSYSFCSPSNTPFERLSFRLVSSSPKPPFARRATKREQRIVLLSGFALHI
jgi:hypothetical protein